MVFSPTGPLSTRTLYGKKPMHVRHCLHRSELFTDEALAALIERLPRSHYHVNTMAPAGDRTMTWREGQIDGLSGQEVMDAVRNGHIWVSLQRLEEIDDNFAAMLSNIYGDVESRVDGLKTYKQSLGLLISSPKAQVYYHCDIPGQSLWQIRGRKRVYVYPNAVPFLTPEYMETIVLGEADEEHMPYEPWYDDHATVYEMEAGDMLHWPLNAPHRVENLDSLNVSLTTEHWGRRPARFLCGALCQRRLEALDRRPAARAPDQRSRLLCQDGPCRRGQIFRHHQAPAAQIPHRLPGRSNLLQRLPRYHRLRHVVNAADTSS